MYRIFQENAKEEKNVNVTARTIARVERERKKKTHILENKTSIQSYALLNIHARDG